MEYIAHKEESEGLTLEVVPDQDPSNPRENDNAGVFVCWHSRYDLGDSPDTIEKEIGLFKPSPDDFREWMKTPAACGALILPLYLYDHGGITIKAGGISTGGNPFSCPWDSGQVGYAFISRATMLKEWGKGSRLSSKARAAAKDYLLASVEEYADYLEGNVYGFRVKDEEGEVLDSCWGFIGLKYAKEEGAASLKREAAARVELRRKNEMTLAAYAD